MKDTRLIMGMPISVEVLDKNVREKDLEDVFAYFVRVDEKFSTYKNTSEISMINSGALERDSCSEEMKTVLRLCEDTKRATGGYFDIETPDGILDPSGLVKGWAIYNASELLRKKGFADFYIDAGGDIQTRGQNSKKEQWKIGIRNPFNRKEIVKAMRIREEGVATSGTYARGRHIYNPKNKKPAVEIVSLTVIGPNVYEADRFATAAFAMGKNGISFIETLKGFEGYSIDAEGSATMTRGFENYVLQHA